MDNRERRVEFFRKFKNMEGERNSDFVLQTNSHYSYISRKIFQGKEKYYASGNGAYDSFKEAFTSFSQGERWYLDLCEKLDVEPKDCLMIGNDERQDIFAASSAGMNCYLVTDYLYTYPECKVNCEKGSFEDLIEKLKVL